MAKASSFKNEPWTSFDRGSYSIFDDDFISDKMTFKFNKKSSSSGFAFKDNISINKDGKANNYVSEIKAWFPIKKHSLYLRVKSDSWKAHIDNGTF